MIPIHPYQKEPSRVSFPQAEQPAREKDEQPRQRASLERIEHETALAAIDYPAWVSSLPAITKCRKCQAILRLTILDRCGACDHLHSLPELIRQKSKALRRLEIKQRNRDRQRVRTYCKLCGARIRPHVEKQFSQVNLNCFILIGGQSEQVRACSLRCHQAASKKWEDAIKCQKQQKREMGNLKSVMSAMKSGLKQMHLKASLSPAPESTTLGTSPD